MVRQRYNQAELAVKGVVNRLQRRVGCVGPLEARTAALGAQLEQNVCRVMNIRLPVRLANRNSLPRFELRANRWQDRRPEL